jgi:hypothetical protein
MNAITSYLRKSKKIEVSPEAYRNMLRSSVTWTQTRYPNRFRWYLVHDVPIRVLDSEGIGIPSLDDFEVTGFDDDIERYRVLYEKLIEHGEVPWPVVVSPKGEILDGIHRLSVLMDAGIKKIDVLWAREAISA